MTPAEVKAKRKELEIKVKELELQRKYLQMEFQYLQSQCDHPHAYKREDTSLHVTTYCDDCGYND